MIADAAWAAVGDKGATDGNKQGDVVPLLSKKVNIGTTSLYPTKRSWISGEKMDVAPFLLPLFPFWFIRNSPSG